MKKLLISAVVLGFLTFTGCSDKKEAEAKAEVKSEVKADRKEGGDLIKETPTEKADVKTLTGTIVMVGNEPFTQLSVKTDKNTFALKGEKNILLDLQKNQGQKYELTYKQLQDKNAIEIVKATKLNKEEE